MQMDLRTVSITPLRQTFDHLARRMGADKPASRYMEGTMDLQPVENFHYRPTWAPQYEIYDAGRTRITMADWYALKDPRQYYYGAYTMARARMQDAADADFKLAEEVGLAAGYAPEGRDLALKVLMPLRHVAWASNMNNCSISAYGYGTAITQAALFCAMDQLGIAQYLTRLAMAFDSVDALAEGKRAWLEDETWQGLRKYCEDAMVEEDWFALLINQDFVLDGLLYPLIYDETASRLNQTYGPLVSMLTRFQREWFGEVRKWVDAVIKVVARESPENKALLESWIRRDLDVAVAALRPMARQALGDPAETVLDDCVQALRGRAAKAGLTL